MNKQAKVGTLIIFFLLTFVLIALWLKGNPFQKTRTLNVLFENVHGVSLGSSVEYAGLECGKVTGFIVTPDGVITKIKVFNTKVKVYEGDRFIIAPSSTIASEYKIFIIPTRYSQTEVNESVTLIGQSSPGIQDLLFQSEETLEKISILLDHLNQSISDVSPVFAKVGKMSQDGTLDRFSQNILDSTESIKGTSQALNSILRNNRKQVETLLVDLSAIADSARTKLDPITADEIHQIVKSIKSTAQNLEGITGAIDKDDLKRQLETFSQAAKQVDILSKQVQDEGLAQNLGDTAKRINRISEGLESSLNGKSLIRGLFTKVRIQDKGNKKCSPKMDKVGNGK